MGLTTDCLRPIAFKKSMVAEGGHFKMMEEERPSWMGLISE
jgi:hypothetical protein